MDSVVIEILNPKVLKMLESMQELELIKMQSSSRLTELLKTTRVRSYEAPSDSEIQQLVKEARAERNEEK